MNLLIEGKHFTGTGTREDPVVFLFGRMPEDHTELQYCFMKERGMKSVMHSLKEKRSCVCHELENGNRLFFRYLEGASLEFHKKWRHM